MTLAAGIDMLLVGAALRAATGVLPGALGALVVPRLQIHVAIVIRRGLVILVALLTGLDVLVMITVIALICHSVSSLVALFGLCVRPMAISKR